MDCPKFGHIYLTNICGNRCAHCPVRLRYPFSRGITADFDDVARYTREFAELGGRWIEYSGGDVTLFDRLPELLELCNGLGMKSSISLSGSNVVARIKSWGEKWLRLPFRLRISDEGGKDYLDAYRGRGNSVALQEILGATSRVRAPASYELVFTLVPGNGGNINRANFDAVLGLAKQLGILVNLNPLFGTDFVGNKVEVDLLWANLTSEQRRDIAWIVCQPQINQQSLKKLEFLYKGGNAIANPSCRSGRATLTVFNNRLLLPCYQNPHGIIPIIGSLQSTILTKEYQVEADLSGTFDICFGCMIWCNLIPSWALDHIEDIPAWENDLLGM